MKYDASAIGKAIRQLRTSKGMSQEILSGFANIARSHLAMIEAGNKAANMETLWKIAQAFEMPLNELIRMAEQSINE